MNIILKNDFKDTKAGTTCVLTITSDGNELICNGVRYIDEFTDRMYSMADLWSHLEYRTGLSRSVCKSVVLEVSLSDMTYPEIIRKHKLRLTDVSSINTAFNEWSGAGE